MSVVVVSFGNGVLTDLVYYCDRNRWLKKRRYTGNSNNKIALIHKEVELFDK